MNSDNSDIVIGLLIGAVVGFLIGGSMGVFTTASNLRESAMAHGYAHYDCNKENNTCIWKWNN